MNALLSPIRKSVWKSTVEEGRTLLGTLTKETSTTYHYRTPAGNSGIVSKRPVMSRHGVVTRYVHTD